VLAIGFALFKYQCKADHSFRNATRLTSAARTLVEALIERKVSEKELVAAHKDASADRALLARLTVDGLDVAGADPLFPDLDRLEELIQKAHQGEAQ